MKIKHLVTIEIVTILLLIILETFACFSIIGNLLSNFLLIILIICPCFIVYIFLRNLFQAIKGLVTKKVMVEPEADILRSEIERLSKRVEELEKDR